MDVHNIEDHLQHAHGSSLFGGRDCTEECGKGRALR